MAIVPNDTRFIGINPTVNLRERRSARINRETQPVSMQDITDSVRPYKVFTTLVSQAGNSQENEVNGSDPIYKGSTYIIVSNGGGATDLSEFGAPNNDVGTYFICSKDGNVPVIEGGNITLNRNLGAPTAVVLENTIGNIWFTFENDGKYYINSSDLFINYKTFINGASLTSGGDRPVFNRMIGESGDGFGVSAGYFFLKSSDSVIKLDTLGDAEVFENDIIADSICIEIRVYN